MGYAINPAKYRHLITIQQPSQARTDTGGFTTSWTAFAADVRAAVKPYTGREYWAAGQTQAEATTVFTIRWRAGVTQDMRVVFDGRVFEIVGPPVDVDARRQELHITAVEKTEAQA